MILTSVNYHYNYLNLTHFLIILPPPPDKEIAYCSKKYYSQNAEKKENTPLSATLHTVNWILFVEK